MPSCGLCATLLAVAAAAVLCGGSARADGDPASDTLVFTNAFLPAHAPSKANADALRAQIAAVYTAGYRIKVAVVGARYDLGAVSGRASARLVLRRGSSRLVTTQVPMHPTSVNRPERQSIVVPSGVSLAATRACVEATDPSGNTGRSCHPVVVKR